MKYLLKKNKYDLVHIHGIGYATLPAIECCERNNVRYLVTLHGLNSFSESTNCAEKERQLERDFLKRVAQKNSHVTVVSTGIKSAISDFLGQEANNFCVVLNGFDIVDNPRFIDVDIRKKHSIDKESKIMLCVGNITTRKNQMQVVKAYAGLPQHLRDQLVVLFLGKNFTNGKIDKSIYDLGLNKRLILCGNVPRNELTSYYAKADYTVLTSISEGFGLSIIEGFTFGLPSLVFADLYAASDLFDEKAMIIVHERTDEALKRGVIAMLSTDWDKEFIKKHSRKFSLQNMAQKYVNVYRDVIQQE